MSECPVCGASIAMQGGTIKGELIECKECGTELEVTGISPLALTTAPVAEEDWGE